MLRVCFWPFPLSAEIYIVATEHAEHMILIIATYRHRSLLSAADFSLPAAKAGLHPIPWRVFSMGYNRMTEQITLNVAQHFWTDFEDNNLGRWLHR